ncbi:hypothetical protein SDC9_12242 [bioreactor metagenome]|uniref:Uncharacterized protein n=1 Tax=bioreactor metagenome TaxID=1076179 RepID=A0A644THT6_9ZZZZ
MHVLPHEEDPIAHHQIGRHEAGELIDPAELHHSQIKRDHVGLEGYHGRGENDYEEKVFEGKIELAEHVARQRRGNKDARRRDDRDEEAVREKTKKGRCLEHSDVVRDRPGLRNELRGPAQNLRGRLEGGGEHPYEGKDHHDGACEQQDMQGQRARGEVFSFHEATRLFCFGFFPPRPNWMAVRTRMMRSSITASAAA